MLCCKCALPVLSQLQNLQQMSLWLLFLLAPAWLAPLQSTSSTLHHSCLLAGSWWRSSQRGLETHSWASQRASWLCRLGLPHASPYCLQSGTPLSLSTCNAHLHCSILHAVLQRQASLWQLPLSRGLHQQCCKSSVWLHMSACTSHHSCLLTLSSCLQLFWSLHHQKLWWSALHCLPLFLELLQSPPWSRWNSLPLGTCILPAHALQKWSSDSQLCPKWDLIRHSDAKVLPCFNYFCWIGNQPWFLQSCLISCSHQPDDPVNALVCQLSPGFWLNGRQFMWQLLLHVGCSYPFYKLLCIVPAIGSAPIHQLLLPLHCLICFLSHQLHLGLHQRAAWSCHLISLAQKIFGMLNQVAAEFW